MGKLNYINRKIDGLKLGQVVAKDLMKRVTPGPISKAALRDPYFELDVSGRQLTDAGFAEIAVAISSLGTHDGDSGNVVRLQELCLAGNGLTVGCLLALIKVVQDAAGELRDLDLSDNNISVSNAEDAVVWEKFLGCFRACSVLRRLNLGGNALGAWAFEILVRVYANEEPLDLLALEDEDLDVLQEGVVQAEHGKSHDGVSGLSKRVGKMKVGPEIRDDTEHASAEAKDGSRRKKSRKNSSASKTVLLQPTHAVEARSIFATTRGLRSIPYIIFKDTSMTDVCALHLSYVVENHGLPKQLLPYVPAKAGSSAREHDAHVSSPGCQGIVYLPNDELSSAGLKVLEVAELVRKGADSESFEGDGSPSKSSYIASTYSRRTSDASWGPLSSQSHRRRRSTLSSGTHASHAGATPTAASELDRARSRIQGSMIKEHGPRSVDLWGASLHMLSTARLILLEQPNDEPASKPTYASKLKIGASVPSEPITGISNTPATPVITRKREGSNGPASRQTTPLTSTLQADNVPVAINTSPDPSTMPFGLSEALWRKIIALASGAVGIVSNEQQESIITWAKNRDTLSRERGMLGKTESEQIWRVLEGMGCLSYDVRT